MSEEEKKQLQQQLWHIANELRGNMNADEFRVYILGFIFFKYLSEKLHLHANGILDDDMDDYSSFDDDHEVVAAVRMSAIEELGYMLKPSELFSVIAKRGNKNIDEDQDGNEEFKEVKLDKDGNKPDDFILEDLTRILHNLEDSTMGTESEDDFLGLFEDLDLTSRKLGNGENAKNRLIAKVLAHLDDINFDLANKTADVLGDAYEYLISKFASGAGKKAGEFYTPAAVSEILAKIVTTNKKQLKTVYDPTCGSGSLLLRVAREADKVGEFFGQEKNPTTYNLARMNMILHGVNYRDFNIKQADTLVHPQHINHKFDAIVANPPFSTKWSASSMFMADDRFSEYGKLAPSSKADYAFILHMIYHMDDDCTLAVVMPHGVLFRGAAEGTIRKHLIDEMNLLDAVIGLPANVFFGTSIPTCIMIFKKCRNPDDNILFIDASKEFEKDKNQNILRPEHIDKIIETFRNRETVDKFSYVVKIKEIEENNFNLNIPRYVDTFEEETEIDLNEVTAELVQIDQDMIAIDASITEFCQQLGIKAPF